MSAQDDCNRFNALVPVGGSVAWNRGITGGAFTQYAVTATAAWVNGTTPVLRLQGVAGTVRLDQLTPASEPEVQASSPAPLHFTRGTLVRLREPIRKNR